MANLSNGTTIGGHLPITTGMSEYTITPSTIGIGTDALYFQGTTGVWNTSGNFSIGNTNNTYKLEVTGTAKIDTSLRIGGTTLTAGYILELSGSNNKGRANDWTATSDINLKTNIVPYTTVLPGLVKLKNSTHGLSTYNRWKLNNGGRPTDASDDKIELGLIAQEVKMIFPELVSGSSDEYYDISYMRLSAISAIGVAELKEEKDKEITELKSELKDLKELVQKIINK